MDRPRSGGDVWHEFVVRLQEGELHQLRRQGTEG